LELIERLHIFVFRIRIVKVEVVVLNVFGNTVNFELWVMDVNLGVGDGHYVDFTLLSLLFKERPFSHTDTDIHLGAAHVVQCRSHLTALLVNENVEVDIDVATQRLVKCILIKLRLLLLFKCATAVSSSSFHLLDVTDHIARAWLVILLHISLTLTISPTEYMRLYQLVLLV